MLNLNVMVGLLSLPGAALAQANLLTNPGAESGAGNDAGSTVTNWTVTAGGGTAQRDDGTDDGYTPPEGSYSFYVGSSATTTLSQVVNLASAGYSNAVIDAGTATANLSFAERSLDQGSSDSGEVNLIFLDASTTAIGTGYSSGEIQNVTTAFVTVTGQAGIPVGTRSIEYDMVFTRHAGSDLDAFIDANSLTVSTPEPAGLTVSGVILSGILLRRRRGF